MESYLTTLADQYNSDKGTTPGEHGHSHRYTYIYENYFSHIRDKALNILEIGIFTGKSLRLWETYFKNANIVGIDINPDCYQYASERSKVEIGDASDAYFLNYVIKKHFPQGIDIIIDDGSHQLHHQIASFITLFPHLNENGLYFVEDICASRFPEFKTKKTSYLDFLDFTYSLAAQTTFFKDSPPYIYHSITDVKKLREKGTIPDLNYFNKYLFSVQIYHNLCVFIKSKRIFPEGNDQNSNDMALAINPADVESIYYHDIILSNLKYENEALKKENSKLHEHINHILNSRSWMLTKPLRFFIKNIKAMIKTFSR